LRHILFFSNHLRGPKGAAGARSWHQAKCLSESFDVTVVIPRVDPVTAKPVTEETYAGLDPDRVRVMRLPTFRNDRSSLARRALYYLSAMAAQFCAGFRASAPDVVLSMSLPITQLVVAAFVAWARRVPLVVDVRDMPFETAEEVGYIKGRHLLGFFRLLETRMLQRAEVIVTNSPYYKRYLSERGLPGDRMHVAPIGYDDFGEPDPVIVGMWRERLTHALGATRPMLIGIYAGTLGYAFPVDEILRGATLLNDEADIGFVFLGDGQRLEEYRQSAGANRVRAVFLGRVSKADVHAACRAADFCIYPASPGKFSSAILGNKVFDYLGAAKPIIYVGGKGAVADVISELEAGVLCGNGEPEAFAAAVRALRDDRQFLERLSLGASTFRRAGYTARASAERLRDLIGATLAARSAKA
jgi:colanic acid biosynthesis glycosyl transferase WcaI